MTAAAAAPEERRIDPGDIDKGVGIADSIRYAPPPPPHPPHMSSRRVRDIDREEANIRSGVGNDDDNDDVASSLGDTTPAD